MKACCTSTNSKPPLLMLIDIQVGFCDPKWGPRNNPDFEKNARRLLEAWRAERRPVIHVQHLSLEADSPLREEGAQFMDFVTPFPFETIVTKHVNSAFIGTNLEETLKQAHWHELVIIGLTTDHCVSTTTRMAANLGFVVNVISDATATFARKSIDGDSFPAELVHEVSLASLSGEFARIESTDSILKKSWV